MLLKKTLLNKCISVFITMGLILSSSGIGGFAAPATSSLNTVYPAIENVVPFNLGKVTNSADFSTSKVIVQIQDLHGDPQTQKNTASILSYLDKKYGISNIYVEGAPKGSLSTKWLADISDNSTKKAFIETMMSGGELSGAEYFSVIENKTDILNGVENFDAYSENLVRLGEMKKNLSVVEARLLPLRMQIEALGQKNYSADNKKILALSQKYKKNEITTAKYFGTLFKFAHKYGISIDKYPQLSLFKQILSVRKKINTDTVAKETAAAIGLLKEKLPFSEYKTLTELLKSPETKNVFYLELSKHLQKMRDYENFPQIRQFASYILLNAQVNPIDFVRQEEMFVNEIRNKSSQNLSEREILFMERFVSIFESLLQNKINFREYKNYNYAFNEFEHILDKYIISANLDDFRKAIDTAEKFYSVNTDRDEYFVKSIFTEKDKNTAKLNPVRRSNTEAMLEKAKKIDVIISGGFHTAGISRLLENKKQSYVVITPETTCAISEYDNTYNSIISRQATMFERNAFDFIKKSAVFEMSPLSVDPVKAVFTIIFSEDTLRKLHANRMLDAKAIENVINSGYGKKVVEIESIKIEPEVVYINVNGQEVTIKNGKVFYERETIEDEIADYVPTTEVSDIVTVQNAVIDFLILSVRHNVGNNEIDAVFDTLNRYYLDAQTISVLKNTARKFSTEQRKYIENKISRIENNDGKPLLSIYKSSLAAKIKFKPLAMAVENLHSVFVAPFVELGDMAAIINGTITQKDFLEKHEQYINGDLKTRMIMERALASIINTTIIFGGNNILGKTVNYFLHMFHNAKAVMTHSQIQLSKSKRTKITNSVYELMKANGLGAIYDGTGTNFGVYSKNAEKIELCLFDEQGNETRYEMVKGENDVWNIYLPDIKPGQRYGFRAYGPYEPQNGHYFNPNKLAVDPFSFQQESRFVFDDSLIVCEKGNLYKPDTRDSAPFVPKSIVVDLRILDDIKTAKTPVLVDNQRPVIYELHVGGFTALKDDLPQEKRGRLQGLADDAVIEHLKTIGINTVEVQPIQSDANDPYSHERGLRNNSGYQTVTFFALNPDFGDPLRPGEDLAVLKETIGKLSENGIRFGMDVVDNHTGEGSAESDPSLCYRLLDNSTYYLLNPYNKAGYDDASGCGNAFNTNNPVVLNMMTKYKEMYALLGVRLFRHDLMAAAARNEETREFDPTSEYMQIFYNSPILSDIREREGIDVVAEGYMATGGAKGVRSYYTDDFRGDIFTWNSGIREAIRNFIMGRSGPGALASAIADPNGIGTRAQPYVYYMGSHDGHPYAQLLAVREKDNFDNGWGNNDGPNEYGMGLGYDNEHIGEYVAAAMTILSFCQGPIMFSMGDEFLRTQHGNNNPYNQSNEYLNMRWDRQAPLEKYMSALAKYRSEHPTLDSSKYKPLVGRVVNENGDKDIAWLHPEGGEAQSEDWQEQHFGFMISGDRLKEYGIYDDDTIVLMNMSDTPIHWKLPSSAKTGPWRVYCSTRDLDLSEQGHEVYNDVYVVTPGEAVILYKSNEQKMENTDMPLQTALTVSYPNFIENVKFAPLKNALVAIYSIFVAPFSELSYMMSIVSGTMTQKEFLEKHKQYINGNENLKLFMENRLSFIIKATALAGGTSLTGKAVNIVLHMLNNIQAFLLSSVEQIRNSIRDFIIKRQIKKLDTTTYVINTSEYNGFVRRRAEELSAMGVKVAVIANYVDDNLFPENVKRDDSLGFTTAKMSIDENIDVYFTSILSNADSTDIFDALSNNGTNRIIFEERVKEDERGNVLLGRLDNIVSVNPEMPVYENIEIALQSARSEERVKAMKKMPVNMDYVFEDELSSLESVQNRIAETADKNFDTIVVSSALDIETLRTLIAEAYNKNIRVILTHEITNTDMNSDISSLLEKMSSSKYVLNENDFAAVEGVILRFEKIDTNDTGAVQNVENSVQTVEKTLNTLTRSGYIGVQLDTGNKMSDFKFKNEDIVSVTLSDMSDMMTYPEDATILFYVDKNAISPDSIMPSDIADMIKRFEKAQTIIIPGWLVDFAEHSDDGFSFNPVKFLRARLGNRSRIAATLTEAVDMGRLAATEKGYYVREEGLNILYKLLSAIRKGEVINDNLIEAVLNVSVSYKSLSGKTREIKLAETPIVKGELLDILINYKNEQKGKIVLKQFGAIVQGILETSEFKKYVKREYSNTDDFENYALALVEARLLCFESGIEVKEFYSEDEVPYIKELEKVAGVTIDGLSDTDSDRSLREQINVLFETVNDSETKPQDKALALADLLQLLAMDMPEINIAQVLTNGEEIQNIKAILSAA